MLTHRKTIKLNDLDLVVLNHLIHKELTDYPSAYAEKNTLINDYRKMLRDAKLHLNRLYKERAGKLVIYEMKNSSL
jgi:hypothetical protein